MMDIVKKNVVSIICGVIALAALVVGLVMIPGKAEALQKEVDARKAAHDSLAGLLHKERQLPVVNPDNPTQEKLTQFPSEAVIKKGTEITKAVENESNAMRNAAVEMNRHVLLEPNSLPSPSPTKAFAFRTVYQQVLPLPPQGGAIKSRFAQMLNAGMPPTPEEIKIKQEDLAKQIRDKKLFMLPNGQPGNQAAVEQEIKDRAGKLPEELRVGVANSSRVYINPDTFEIYPKIASAVGAPDAIDMYFAQLSYWLQEDVVKAVAELNSKFPNVIAAPVKHLIQIRVKAGGMPTFITAADGQANADPDGPLPKATTVSPTGRVSNGLYDVFHLMVEADVEAEKVPDFLRALGTRRFITPLWVDVRGRDTAMSLAQGHVYGNKQVLNVRAECEVLYLRKWNAPLMPLRVREKLGITADGAPAAAPAAAAVAP